MESIRHGTGCHLKVWSDAALSPLSGFRESDADQERKMLFPGSRCCRHDPYGMDQAREELSRESHDHLGVLYA